MQASKIKKTNTAITSTKGLKGTDKEIVELVNDVSEFVYNIIDECVEPHRGFFLAVQAAEFQDRALELIRKKGVK